MFGGEHNRRRSVRTETAKKGHRAWPWSGGSAGAARAAFSKGHIQWSPVLFVACIERCAVHHQKFNDGIH
jgi:hypothetical protein